MFALTKVLMLGRATACVAISILILSVLSKVQGEDPSGEDLHQSLVGAWVYAGSPGTDTEPVDGAELKVWGLKHFFVTKRDPDTNEVTYHHGGTYTLNDNVYIETVRYGTEQVQQLVGQSFKFKIEIDGDSYVQRGVGNPYTQRWSRLTVDAADTLGTTPRDEDGELSVDVPEDASVDDLFAFITLLERMKPAQQSLKEIRKHAGRVFPSIISAADEIIRTSEDDDESVRAMQSKLRTLSSWVRYEPDVQSRLDEVLQEAADDPRDAIASIASGMLIEKQLEDLKSLNQDEASALSKRTLNHLDRFGANKQTYRTASRVGSMIGRSEHQDAAADLFVAMAERFRAAEDLDTQKLAARMEGTARRMRLLGNEIELSGTIGKGEPFDWNAYRGKVVLVDFWASWCGPCIRELPNMKRNLETYGDDGFAIVGINMDRNREAFENAVEQYEIHWVNLFSEDKDAQGWDAPIARHYGVSAIPTAILVDRDGKVVSLSARGKVLDEQLARLIPRNAAEKAIETTVGEN